jgi:hypothetical protein
LQPAPHSAEQLLVPWHVMLQRSPHDASHRLPLSQLKLQSLPQVARQSETPPHTGTQPSPQWKSHRSPKHAQPLPKQSGSSSLQPGNESAPISSADQIEWRAITAKWAAANRRRPIAVETHLSALLLSHIRGR